MRDLCQEDHHPIRRILNFAPKKPPPILGVSWAFHPSVCNPEIDGITRRDHGRHNDRRRDENTATFGVVGIIRTPDR